MESRWLEDFLSLVETRNFSRSAQARYTTQPAFSRRIKSLEEWVGAQLFDRASQPISLTPAGERFLPVAEDVLRRLYQGREDARRIGEDAASTIRFAATHSLSLNFFPGWLQSIELRSHTFNTRLDTVQFQRCIQMLLRGDCHFILSYTHIDIPMNLPAENFAGKVVLRDRLVPVTLPDNAGQPIDRLPGTKDEPVHYLAYSETSAIGMVVKTFLEKMDEPVFLDRVFVSHMAAVLRPMSSAGRGMAWLPESHIKADIAEGKLVLAGGEKWFIPVDIRLIRSRDPLPALSEEFWSIIETPEDTAWG